MSGEQRALASMPLLSPKVTTYSSERECIAEIGHRIDTERDRRGKGGRRGRGGGVTHLGTKQTARARERDTSKVFSCVSLEQMNILYLCTSVKLS